jgi:predicted  nucleic acid-binding Zn-ribbon protein
MSVSRDKYEKAKEAAVVWYNKLSQSKMDNIQLIDEVKRLGTECERWKKLSEQLPDPNIVEELQNENKTLSKTVRSLKKQVGEMEEKYKDKIAILEREKLLSDGKIQQLEEARKDLYERYNDLKQDFREQQRWGHSRKEN